MGIKKNPLCKYVCIPARVDSHHKAEQSGENGCHGPCWVPGVWVKVADGQAQPCVGLEATVGRDHHDAGRLEGVVPGEYQLAMVIST